MGSDRIIKCEILSPVHSVEHSSSESLIKDGGSLDMSYFGLTEYSFSVDTRLEQGDGFQLLIRPVVMHGVVRDSGLVIIFSKRGVAIDSNGRIISEKKYPTVSDGASVLLSVKSDNTFTEIVYGCDTVYKNRLTKIESDDIVFKTLPKSEVRVIQPEWVEVVGD